MTGKGTIRIQNIEYRRQETGGGREKEVKGERRQKIGGRRGSLRLRGRDRQKAKGERRKHKG